MGTANTFQDTAKKMIFTQSMHRNNNTYMSSGYYFFDSNHKRVKHCVTLTASAYHPLLCKQVVLATMQCKQEDNANNEVDEKFHPTG